MNHKPTKLICEFSEFNHQRMNSDSVQASTHVDDPSLSLNGFDKHHDMIRQANARLNSIMGGVMNNNTWSALRKAMNMDKQDLMSLKILRILSNNTGNWDVYLEFMVGEKLYWGVIRNIASRDPQFTSELFKDFTFLNITKEWIIRTKGVILKAIKKFLTPDAGEYRSLKAITCTDINTGELKKVESGTEIKVERAFDNRILFSISNRMYQLTNENWIYFNYWFEKI